jgi:Na+(H+)/acetate symporter ActP
VNPITAAAGLLMAGAAIFEGYRGSWRMTAIYVCYCVANFILATLR